MKALWKSAIELMKKADNTAAWNRPEFMMGYRNPHFHFQPARWFRGLDVAGDENDLRILTLKPPWKMTIFAPPFPTMKPTHNLLASAAFRFL